MKKLSFRKFSILSLVLLAASAVTAAVMPANKAAMDSRGSLTVEANNGGGVGFHLGQSCTPTAVINDQSCNVTANSGSTAAFGTVSNKTTDD